MGLDPGVYRKQLNRLKQPLELVVKLIVEILLYHVSSCNERSQRNN